MRFELPSFVLEILKKFQDKGFEIYIVGGAVRDLLSGRIVKGKRVKGESAINLNDYYDGQLDLKNKLIRAVGDPNERFSEDALRMMRGVRIAAELGFTIE